MSVSRRRFLGFMAAGAAAVTVRPAVTVASYIPQDVVAPASRPLTPQYDEPADPARQLTPEDISDLVSTTLKDLQPLCFQKISSDLRHYEVFNKWFKTDKVRFDSCSA